MSDKATEVYNHIRDNIGYENLISSHIERTDKGQQLLTITMSSQIVAWVDLSGWDDIIIQGLDFDASERRRTTVTVRIIV